MSRMMNFLLTNDDGIAGPGLWAAARTLAEYGSVLVVAPADNYSGYGAALPAAQTLAYSASNKHNDDLPDVTAFALTGTPATCAQVGLYGAFGHTPFDLVVSGANAGANMGHDVLYSGTVGAALTAQLLGVPAIAISLDNHPGEAIYWEAAEWGLRETLELWLKKQETKPIVLNVNVPNLPVKDLAGLRLTSLGKKSFLTNYSFEIDPLYASTLRVVPQEQGHVPEPEQGTDEWAVAHGYVSITPMQPFQELIHVIPWNAAHRLRTPAIAIHEFKAAPDMIYIADRL